MGRRNLERLQLVQRGGGPGSRLGLGVANVESGPLAVNEANGTWFVGAGASIPTAAGTSASRSPITAAAQDERRAWPELGRRH